MSLLRNRCDDDHQVPPGWFSVICQCCLFRPVCMISSSFTMWLHIRYENMQPLCFFVPKYDLYLLTVQL